MAAHPKRRNSSIELLQELEALSQSLSQSHTNRRTASLALPRSSTPAPDPIPIADPSPHSRRTSMSMSLWRSHPKPQPGRTGPTVIGEKKGIWSWKPMRTLFHIGMQRIGCLFSVEVIAVRSLPASMNGLRLSVAVQKKQTKDGAVHTMPSRVIQGSAEFEETLFIRCHLYCTGKPPKFDPRPFLISAVAVDAPELDFGKSTADLSLLVKESMERSFQGARVRQWDTTIGLSGKAKGGELVLKLGFQIMEDGGAAIYSPGAEGIKRSNNKGRDSSSSFVRRQSKSSFSVTRSKEAVEYNLDKPGRPPESKTEDLELPEFEVVEKGVEIEYEANSKVTVDGTSVSSEVVKEVVHPAHQIRLRELDLIAKEVKALESMMTGDEIDPPETGKGNTTQQLDDDEEMVTRELFQMLELEDDKETNYNKPSRESPLKSGAVEEGGDGAARIFLSDLGKGLSAVVQTRDGGYLVSMNPFDLEVQRKESPKLAMQISRPFILWDQKPASGFEVFQSLASMGSEELASELLSLTAMDELKGKTAEQIAFEGIASAIISGRNKERTSSSAARSIAAIKTMAAAMIEGRKERISSGIWSTKEDPATMEEILAFSLQKMEVMVVEALKIQAEIAEEEAPFDVSPLIVSEEDTNRRPLDRAISLEEWEKACGSGTSITMLVTIQLRDPLRRYEPVGGPAIAVVQATRVDGGGEDEEGKFKVTGLHIGGLKLSSGAKRSNCWDGERQRQSAVQWLVAYGLGKEGKMKKKKKKKAIQAKVGKDLVWSLSSRVIADMWLKPMRNPDVKVSNQ